MSSVLIQGIGFSFFVTFSDMFHLSRDCTVVSGAGNQSSRRKTSSNPKSLSTFSHDRSVISVDVNFSIYLPNYDDQVFESG